MRKKGELDLGKRQPHYMALAQSLMRDIESGRYPVDGLLPTEIELTRQFSMSRHTVREAIRRLQQMGIVTRQQGIGTRVKARGVAHRYVHKVDSIADLFQYVQDAKLVIDTTTEVVANDVLASRLNCRPGQRWLKMTGMRHAEGHKEPICHTEVFIVYEYASVRSAVARTQVPIYRLIEQMHGVQIAEVRQQIRAISIPAGIARLLHVKRASPGLSISRHYCAASERVVEVSFNTYPAHSFTYSMRLSRDVTTE